MFYLHLTLLWCMLNVFNAEPVLKKQTLKKDEAEITNLILQSNDGGQTWQDISHNLPKVQQPADFFVSESDLYIRINQAMYRSKRNLKTPVWEKISIPNVNTSLAFMRSGIFAYNYGAKIFKQKHARKWESAYTNLNMIMMRTLAETADGTLFAGGDRGLYKSVDGGQTWKKIQNEAGVMDIVESEGVLVATNQKGIIRSTDKGEHWELVINEGGVGIDIERIEGGFAAITFNTTTQSRRIHISVDAGKTWKAVSDKLRPSWSTSSIKQLGSYLFVGHPDGIFRSADMGKTWTIVHHGVNETVLRNTVVYSSINNTISDANSAADKKVFNLYLAGNTLYAIARNEGC